MKIITTITELKEVLGNAETSELTIIGLQLDDRMTISAERVDLASCTGTTVTINAKAVTLYRSAFDEIRTTAEWMSVYSSNIDVMRFDGEELHLQNTHTAHMYVHASELDIRESWIGEMVTDEQTVMHMRRSYIGEANYSVEVEER